MKLPRPTRALNFVACVFVLEMAFCLCLTPHLNEVKAAARPVIQREDQAVSQATSATVSRPETVPVLVELFTSEGCSSCPSADVVLARLDREQPVPNADIIVLSEHVDYWDSLGWKDRFSSPDFTQRQKDYQTLFSLSDVHTPQIIINGSVQLNGTDAEETQKAIEQAAVTNAVPLQFTGVQVHGDVITFTLLGDRPATPGYVNVYAALVDPADTTKVLAGENKGRTLRHAGVVRKLVLVGSSWRTKALGKRPFMLQANLPGTPGILDGMRLVVFVQIKHIGPVQGAVSCSLAISTATRQSPFLADPCPTNPSTPNE